MTGAFTWLNNMIQSLGQLIPRLVLIRKTYRGILFRYDGNVALLEPGLTWYWPLGAELRLIPVTIRVFNLDPICIQGEPITWGGIKVPTVTMVAGVIQTKVVNPMMLIEVYSISSSVVGRTRVAMRDLWEAHKHDQGAFELAVMKRLRGELGGFGLTISHFGLTDAYTTTMLTGGVGGGSREGDVWIEGDSDSPNGN